MKPRSRLDTFLDRAERWLESVAVRAVLSVLILVSVLPSAAAENLGMVLPAPLFVARGRGGCRAGSL